MKKMFIICLSLFISLGIFAQEKEASISWDKTTHDFGNFKEEDGVQTATFTFTNTGSSPLFVTNVRSSCGCTTPDWTKDPVQPGESGFVKAAYNPRNRPGRFNKSVTVTTNATQPTTVLRIQGDVTPREKGIEDEYPRVFDDLRMKTSHHAFASVKNNQVASEMIPIVNMGSEPVTITFEGVPSHITIKAVPETLKGMGQGEKHGDKGNIMVTYDGAKANDWGFKMDRIFLVLNGERNNTNRLSISATIEEDFSHLTKDEMANAPKIEFETLEFDFGTLKQGDKANYNFVFTNTGKSDLVIRRIRAACGCTATNPEKMVIKPGESSHITTTFNSRGQRGKQNKTITIITNDPNQSTTVLRVIGNVE